MPERSAKLASTPPNPPSASHVNNRLHLSVEEGEPVELNLASDVRGDARAIPPVGPADQREVGSRSGVLSRRVLLGLESGLGNCPASPSAPTGMRSVGTAMNRTARTEPGGCHGLLPAVAA